MYEEYCLQGCDAYCQKFDKVSKGYVASNFKADVAEYFSETLVKFYHTTKF